MFKPKNRYKIDTIIMAGINLHNFLITENNDAANTYCPSNYIDTKDNTGCVIQGTWRSNVNNVNNLRHT